MATTVKQTLYRFDHEVFAPLLNQHVSVFVSPTIRYTGTLIAVTEECLEIENNSGNRYGYGYGRNTPGSHMVIPIHQIKMFEVNRPPSVVLDEPPVRVDPHAKGRFIVNIPSRTRVLLDTKER